MTQQIIVGTGHRPNKIFVGNPYCYSEAAFQLLVKFFRVVVWPKFKENDIEVIEVVSGGALGFDQAMAYSALLEGIKVHMTIPYKNMEDAWKDKRNPDIETESMKRYRMILALTIEQGGRVSYGYESYQGNWQLLNRNKDMVDQLEGKLGAVLTLSNGDEEGGTAHCIRYAKSKQVRVINFWSLWLKFRSENN